MAAVQRNMTDCSRRDSGHALLSLQPTVQSRQQLFVVQRFQAYDPAVVAGGDGGG